MSEIGTSENPLRVAIVGAGPAGFYAAERLCKQDAVAVEVHLLERLPTPYGLVRGGVAPDHQNYKAVTKVYERIAAQPQVRFFGNLSFGQDVTLGDLKQYFHQVVFCVGALESRELGIPGESLPGSRTAPEFVAWYNGHPDYAEHSFDLSGERAVVIGAGNVALDVARILSKTPAELGQTDIADHALEALRESKIREVVLLGRRGPLQSAFSTRELKEMGQLKEAQFFVDPEDMVLDPFSATELENTTQRTVLQKMELFDGYAAAEDENKPRAVRVRFLTSPVELLAEEGDRLSHVRLCKNRLVQKEGRIRPEATDHTELLEASLVIRSIGYRSQPLTDLPFDDWRGVIPNEEGRILDPESGETRTGEYVSGWIKRGPSGTIGTNRTDSIETVEKMLEDLQKGAVLHPTLKTESEWLAFLREKQPALVTFADWKKIDQFEVEAGADQGRPRVKITSIKGMLNVVKGA